MNLTDVSSLRQMVSRSLRGQSVLITGATGFVGRSLLRESLTLNDRFDAQLSLYLVIRREDEYLLKLTNQRNDVHLVFSSIGDEISCINSLDLVFHCATPASAFLNSVAPVKMLETNVDAMNWILTSMKYQKKEVRIVFTSSGAVYGPQSELDPDLKETYLGAPDVLKRNSAYAEGKRVAEFLLAQAGHTGQVTPVITRLFAFSGIGLPLDRHFAIGNFVSDAINQDTIVVRGSGRDLRSYLDSLDMALWLWVAAARGESLTPLHIGSERSISISELAYLVAKRAKSVLNKDLSVEIQNQISSIDGSSKYVPSTFLTRKALGVFESISLEDSIDMMLTQVLPDSSYG